MASKVRSMVGQRRRLGRRRAAPHWRRLAAYAVVAAVVVVLAVATVSQLGPASASYRRTVNRGFAALVAPIAAESNASGESMRALFRDAATLDRVTMFSSLDTLAADTAAAQRQFAVIASPLASAAGHDCATALAARATATATLQSAIEQVLGGRSGLATVDQAGATDAVAGAGRTLASADASWDACRRQLRAAPGSAVLPVSTWVPGVQYLDTANATRLVAGLLGLHAMAPLPALEVIAVATAPPAVASQAIDVLAPTGALDLDVVVANDGNVDEHDVEVGAVVSLQNSPASPVPVQRTVDIAAGRSSTVTLPALAVEPGASYTVQLTAEAPRSGGPGPIATVTRQFAVEPAATTTAVGSSLSTIAVGQSVTLSAYVSSSLSGIGLPSGTVAFEDDGASIATCAAVPVRSARAICTTALSGGGLHALVATYGGDNHHAGSTSPGISVTVGNG